MKIPVRGGGVMMDKGAMGEAKLGPLVQIGVVVKNIDKVVDYYSSTFGIGPWEIKDGESEAKVGGQTYLYKTRVAYAQLGPVTLELFEVVEGRSPVHAQFLDKDREGVHHLGFYVAGDEKEKMIADLAARGVSVFQDSHIKPSGRTTFLDTAKTGGIFFELIERHSHEDKF
jgi:catechol 2,3-dioxygenase-like lactoylglutathione lyase family enzyme